MIVWITGASSGIGEALALEYARKGATLVLSARREAELARVQAACAPATVYCLPMDLAQPESIEAAVAKAQQLVPQIDILINNGGISQRSYGAETDMAVHRKLMEVNYFGTVHITTLVLRWMLATGGGHIAVVSSLSGKFGFFQRAAYAASKHAVQGFFETLGLEEAQHNIRVTIASPGPVATNIGKNALDKDGNPVGKDDPFNDNGISAQDCAQAIVAAIAAGKREVIVARKEKLMYFFYRFLKPAFYAVAKKLNPRK